tara:strand:+ start:652 stop:894 length:243 start_codon:yes stop_codon:yes gene_type:complete
MERASKKEFETILKRCRNAMTKVENAGATIQNEEEEFHETLYALALNNLRFMFECSFGDEKEAIFGENVADMDNYFLDID